MASTRREATDAVKAVFPRAGGPNELCFWCGAENPPERDHVFPKGLFAQPRPSTLITVPACSVHNRAFSMDEIYFRDFVLASCYSHPEARKLWQTRTRSRLYRNPSYRAMLAARIRRLELRTPRGFFLGAVDALLGDMQRINNVLRKAARGLYYHLYREVLGPIRFRVDQVRADQPPPPAVVSMLRELPPAVEVGHMTYRFGRAQDVPGAVGGAARFFGRVLFVFAGEPGDRDDRMELPRGRARRGGLWLP
jgi:hypothetical protein